ncbi:MAG: family 43 glycosylhydrolase [Cyclobacteriaceae bacterium]
MKQLSFLLNQVLFTLALLFTFFSFCASAQNPIITDRFTADPTARVYNDTLFVFPSSDTTCIQAKGNNGFCMHSYHVYSTVDLTNWTDHGEIINHNNVPWVKPNSYGMWAPDCIKKGDKYYYYFPAVPEDGSSFRRIGVATADRPTGPYTPEESYIEGIEGIDPNVFTDDDGKSYLYYGGGENLYGVELNDDMVSIKGKPIIIQGLPAKYKEGSFVFKRNGIYYFTFPHAPSGSEEISYAIGDSPLEPFTYKAKVLERWKDGCWTNHHSFVEYKDQWYLFYHHFDISNDKHLRSVCVDRVYFDEEGNIPEIKATLRGIGYVSSDEIIQVDRYSKLENGSIVRSEHDFINWFVKGISPKTVLEYHDIDFGDRKEYTSIVAYVSSVNADGKMLIYTKDDQLLASIDLPQIKRGEWVGVGAELKRQLSGNQSLVFKFEGETEGLKVDWIKFIPEGKAVVVGDYNLHVHYKDEHVMDEGSNIWIIDQKSFKMNKLSVENKLDKRAIIATVNGQPLTPKTKVRSGEVMNFSMIKKIKRYDAFEGVPASVHSGQSGVLLEKCSLGGKNVAYIENNDYISFSNIDYTKEPKEIVISVASQNEGGFIEVRKGSTEGAMLAKLQVGKTGGWQNWEDISSTLSGSISSDEKLYLIFKGGNGFLFNVNQIRFR